MQNNLKEQEWDIITPFSIHINRIKWIYDIIGFYIFVYSISIIYNA